MISVPSAPPSSADTGSRRTSAWRPGTSAVGMYGRLATIMATGPAMPARRSLREKITRSASETSAAFSRASASASSERSTPVTRTDGTAFASASAMQPVPVPTSTTGADSHGQPPAFASATSNSQSCSVSGRGISARGSHFSVRPRNSTVPSRCWSGSPCARRRTRSRNGVSSFSPSGRSNSR
jgi:hypothetical protein